jgi:hypothetical protein
MNLQTLPPSPPTIQPIPQQELYSLDTLNLFARYTRASFFAKHKQQAPPYTQEGRIKRWYDSTCWIKDPEGLYVYKAWIGDSKGSLMQKEFFMTNLEAGRLNLPGKYDYPAFNPAPLKARVVWLDTFLPAPTPDGYCLESEVQKLAQAISKDIAKEVIYRKDDLPTSGPGSIRFDPEEERRSYSIQIEDDPNWLNAGLLIRSSSQLGVGYPGTWKWDGTALAWVPAYIAQISGEFDQRPEWPMPQRDLQPDERFIASAVGGFQVGNASFAKPDPVFVSPGFKSALTQVLQQIIEQQGGYWLDRLLKKLPGSGTPQG